MNLVSLKQSHYKPMVMYSSNYNYYHYFFLSVAGLLTCFDACNNEPSCFAFTYNPPTCLWFDDEQFTLYQPPTPIPGLVSFMAVCEGNV